METKIILAAFNARYAHTAFGARYLLANLGELRAQADLLEFDLQIQPRIAIEKILARHPSIVGIGCTIWNIDLATRVAALLRALRPDLKIILGGPEISYETEAQEIFQHADHVICGEGETEFPRLCHALLGRREAVPQASRLPRIIQAAPVDLAQIQLPYDLYTAEDIAHRVLYVEASRGCPFRCEYCMSSLDPKVRPFPEAPFFQALEKLLDRGATRFKFVDRTFNLDIAFALRVLAFFRERHRPGMHLHFEVIPDHLPDELMEAARACPPGLLQFEIGIQTFNEEVAHRIQRPLDIGKIEANLRRLRQETGVHIHADLIAGLPGEDLASFEAGFNRLLALDPQEIQLGILKRLRGAPISKHSNDWKMVYSPHAPYEILQTSCVSFEEMQRVSRFARYWNLTVNNGRFPRTAPLIWKNCSSPFAAFMQWSDWLYAQTNTTGNLHLVRLARLLLEFLTEERNLDAERVATALRTDYQSGGRTDLPGFLKPKSVPQASRLPDTTGFNPLREIHQTRRKNLPHWTQDDCIYFVTFRLVDSIAQSRIREYEELREKWREHHHPPYSETERQRFNELFSQRVDGWLDEGAGSCALKDPALGKIVADALLHFDGDRYELDEWVVMPNHVHVLVRPLGEHTLAEILHAWKSFSAHAINKATRQTGPVWQRESYDHIVRDLAELRRIQNYIRRNPEKAGLRVAYAGSRRDACDTQAPNRTAGVPPAKGEE